MEVEKFSPFVYWAQNQEKIFMKVDLKDAQNPDIIIEEKSLTLSCKGTGAQGFNNYCFKLDFYDLLNVDKSNYKVLDNCIKFSIIKLKHEWWPRLISQPLKPQWLKIDFDRWQSPEDIVNQEQVGDIMKNHSDILDNLQKEEFGYRKEESRIVYLTCFNFFMLLGFLYIFIVLLVKYLKDGIHSFPHAFNNVGNQIILFQVIQALEIIHPVLKIKKGSFLQPLLQIFGRNFILLLLKVNKDLQTSPILFYMFFVWSLIEIIRYPYYLSRLHGWNNESLTWLRYHAWIVCYPIGWICEVFVVYNSIIFLDASKIWAVNIPNPWNFAFNVATLLRIYLLFITTPGIIYLLVYMFRIRQRKYGSKKRK